LSLLMEKPSNKIICSDSKRWIHQARRRRHEPRALGRI
jgi:hypothetical protein